MIRVTLFFFFSTLICVAFTQEFDPGRHLSTKTPYYPQGSPQDYTPPPPGCRLVHVNLVARHGSRNPTIRDVENFVELQATLDAEEHQIPNKTLYQWMIDWENPYDYVSAGELREVGEEEHYYLAKRLLQAYPELFVAPSVSNEYIIRTTQVPRAARSGNAFGFGLFEGLGILGPSRFKPFYTYSESKDRDHHLRFFKTCSRYSETIVKSNRTYEERDKYLATHLPNIASRLSATFNWTVSVDITMSMYKACQFEYSLFKRREHWCSIFTPEEFEIFEYANDLSFYYEAGYGGAPLACDIACPLLQDIIDSMDEKINPTKHAHHIQRAIMRFTHAEAIIPFLCLLGLFNDTHKLTATSPNSVIEKRSFRTSVMCPYAANIMFSLYNCTTEGSQPEYKVKLLINEKEHTIPRCGEMYCPFNTFKELYLAHHKCNFDSICSLDMNNPTLPPQVGNTWSPAVGAIATLIGCVVGFLSGRVSNRARLPKYERLNNDKTSEMSIRSPQAEDKERHELKTDVLESDIPAGRLGDQ